MRKWNKKILLCSERGGAIAELVLALPILIILTLSTVELSRQLQLAQLATTLSKEAADQTFRKCADLTVPAVTVDAMLTATRNQIQACIAQAVLGGDEGIQVLADAIFPNNPNDLNTRARVRVAVYRFDDFDPDINANAPGAWQTNAVSVVAETGVVPDLFATRYGLPGVNQEGISEISNAANALTPIEYIRNRRMVVAEVYVPYAPVFTFLPWIDVFTGPIIYSSTII